MAMTCGTGSSRRRDGTARAMPEPMSLHITSDEEGGLRTVHVAGALGFDGLGELLRACREAPRLQLDLSELLTADEAGTNLLAALRDEGAELVSVSPYVYLLLRARHGRAL